MSPERNTPLLPGILNDEQPKSLPPCGRRPRDKENPYPCESNQPLSGNNEHLRPKQDISNLFAYIINYYHDINPEIFIGDESSTNELYIPDYNFDPVKYINDSLNGKMILQNPLFDDFSSNSIIPKELLNAKKHLIGDENWEYRQVVSNFLFWMASIKQNANKLDILKSNISIPPVFDNTKGKLLSRGICDAVYFQKKPEGIKIFEFKIGDPDTYNRSQRQTHRKQILEYITRMSLFCNNLNMAIKGQLIYFSYYTYEPFAISEYSLEDTQ